MFSFVCRRCGFHTSTRRYEKNWVQRQTRDPYVRFARINSYRCRSAFKLIEMDNSHHFLTPGTCVVDLGAAPGSWTQVSVQRTNALLSDSSQPKGKVIALDRRFFASVNGAICLPATDITAADTIDKVRDCAQGYDVTAVLSDMAPNASGVMDLDLSEITRLCLFGLRFAEQILASGGCYLSKLWQSSNTNKLVEVLQTRFQSVRVVKPKASRSDSAEIFLLARGFTPVRK